MNIREAPATASQALCTQLGGENTMTQRSAPKNESAAPVSAIGTLLHGAASGAQL